MICPYKEVGLISRRGWGFSICALLLGIGLGLGLGSDKRVRVSNSRSGTAREQVKKVT